MALHAVYIRGRSLSADSNDSDHAAWQRQLGSEVAPITQSATGWPRIPSRPGLGSFSSTTDRNSADDDGWHSLRTGESPATRALRMRHRFVKATALSDPSLRKTDQAATSHPSGPHQAPVQPIAAPILPTATPIDHPDTSTASLAQLYSQLAQDMSSATSSRSAHPARLTPGSSSSRTQDSGSVRNKRNQEEEHHHSHHHRHQPDARHRSEWFISRALAKMQRIGHASLSKTSLSASPASGAEPDNIGAASQPSSSSRNSRCPRCGDSLPADATPEYMARHRQSIGHRLGLNAPVSSASASEAPSPDSSQPPTPASRSRTSSPPPTLPPNAQVQVRSQRPGKLPRRLSHAPRWKKISRDNIGHSLLSRMGWKEGMGLGVQEWKWQQLGRERVRKQQSDAVRALLLRRPSDRRAQTQTFASTTNVFPKHSQQHATGGSFATEMSTAQQEPEWLQLLLKQQNVTDPSASRSLQTTFPFELDLQTQEQQLEATKMWLSGHDELDAEWFQALTLEEQDTLQQALLSGEIMLQDVQHALWSERQADLHGTVSLDPSFSASAPDSIAKGAGEELVQSSALLYPVEVELRSDRSGIGVKSNAAETESNGRQRRRSRAAEGSIDIRRQSLSGSPADGHKRIRLNPTSRPFKSSSRSRSRSSTGGSRLAEQHADLTRRQRELARQREKRDWLDLRASLS